MLDLIYSEINRYFEEDYDFSLADKIGLCALFANKYKQSGNDLDYMIYESLMEKIISIDKYSQSDLIYGSSSVLWLFKYLKKIEILDYSSNLIRLFQNKSIDGFNNGLRQNNWNYHYNGSLGYLIAIQDVKYDEVYLNYLKSKITKKKNGHLSLLSINYKESTNLGLHAGILGVLAYTSRLIKNNILVPKANEINKILLEIILCKLSDNQYSFFPAMYSENKPCRMCLVYGELILAVQLLAIALLNNDTLLESVALKIAKESIFRDSLEKTLINDSCLFIGSSGNYLLYKILNRYNSIGLFSDAEVLWRNYTFDILKCNNFQTIDRYSNTKKKDFSILEGLSGICLALDNFDNQWHEYILLDTY